MRYKMHCRRLLPANQNYVRMQRTSAYDSLEKVRALKIQDLKMQDVKLADRCITWKCRTWNWKIKTWKEGPLCKTWKFRKWKNESGRMYERVLNDVIDAMKRKFLAKYSVSENSLCQVFARVGNLR